jgi:hypothetical protein
MFGFPPGRNVSKQKLQRPAAVRIRTLFYDVPISTNAGTMPCEHNQTIVKVHG